MTENEPFERAYAKFIFSSPIGSSDRRLVAISFVLSPHEETSRCCEIRTKEQSRPGV
jgi:hypothetical protein